MSRFIPSNPTRKICFPLTLLLSLLSIGSAIAQSYYSSDPIILEPLLADHQWGYTIVAVPDTNGDGFAEVGVQSPFSTVLDLFEVDSGTHLIQIPAPTGVTGSTLKSVSSLPDMNGNGSGEVLFGGGCSDGGVGDCGCVYLRDGASGQLIRTIPFPRPCADFTTAGFGVSVSRSHLINI